jgi:hypothetical protein
MGWVGRMWLWQDTAMFQQAFEGLCRAVPSVRRVEGVMKALAFQDVNSLYYTVGVLTFVYLVMWLLIKVRCFALQRRASIHLCRSFQRTAHGVRREK